MKYKLVQEIEGSLIASEFEESNFLQAMEVRGFTLVGLQDAKRFAGGAPRRTPLRDELHHQPIFAQLCGPMYDGPGVVRYEDQKSNDMLSM